MSEAGAGWVGRLVRAWALLGGALLLLVVLMNVASVVGGVVWKPFPGDFELTEIGVAIAAFAFLPYCQIADLNVTADIFTARASRFWLSVFSLLGALIALGFGLLLTWRMYAGMIDQKTYDATTATLQIPLWLAYAGCLVSLVLLVVASAASLIEAVHAMSRKRT